MKIHVTPKQVAQAIGVSESSVKRWCDQGLIPTERTAGGHRRLPMGGVMQFLRVSDHSLVRPEILSLPPTASGGAATLEQTYEEMVGALEDGDEERFRAAGFNLFLAGYTTVDICDRAMAPAFDELGRRWQHGQIEIYQERRASEIGLKFLHELRASLPVPELGTPLAIGGTFEGDWYALPTTMAEVVLREQGWRAQSYGSSHPPATLEAAVRDRKPDLFWLSVSWIASEDDFVDRFQGLYETAMECGTAVAVGGRALSEDIRRRITYSAFCDRMGHLAAFAAALGPSISNGTDSSASGPLDSTKPSG